MKIEDFEAEHLWACTDLFMSAFSRPPWNERWDVAAATERLSTCYGMPSFHGLVAVEEAVVVGLAMGFVERWYEGYQG